MNQWISSWQALRLIERLVSVGVIISCAEFLAIRAELAPTGLLNFPIPQARARWMVRNYVSPVLDRIFNYPSVLVIICLRLGAATVLLAGVSQGATEATLCLLVAATSIALSLRTPFGNDGADQMTVLIFVALTLARLADTTEAANVSLWFLALQTCLSYLTAGVAKAAEPIWRNGEAIKGIFRTTVYGHSTVSTLVQQYPILARLAGWSVVTTECLFVLSIVCPRPIVFVFLAGGLLFHVASAAVMGLNTFAWAFGATYPAVFYCSAICAMRLWGRPAIF
jgi:hypothetical protein